MADITVKTFDEQVYVVLKGRATLQAGDQRWDLVPGMLVRVGPGVKRKMTPGLDGATVLALGGAPGKAYEPRWKPAR